MHILFSDIKYFEFVSDGENLGYVTDFYVDEETWNSPFLVVETGHWFNSNKILVRASKTENVDLPRQRVLTKCTKEQIENSPSFDSVKTVGEEAKDQWVLNTNHHICLAGSSAIPFPTTVIDQSNSSNESSKSSENHIRSAREVLGYKVSARDGTIGTVSDFVLDSSDMTVNYLVIDTGTWLPGKLVVFSPKWTNEISWLNRQISLDLDKEKIEKGPDLRSIKDLETLPTDELYKKYGYPVF